MKKIIRTIPGKVTLIFLFVLCFATVVLSGVGANFAHSNWVYEETMEERIYDVREKRVLQELRSFAVFVVWGQEYLHNENAGIIIYDAVGQVIRENKYAQDLSKNTDCEKFEYSMALIKDENGEIVNLGIDRPWLASQPEEVWTAVVYTDMGKPMDAAEAGMWRQLEIAYSIRYWVYLVGGVAILLCIALLVTLICVAGRKPNTEQITVGVLGKIPFELLLIGAGAIPKYLLSAVSGSYDFWRLLWVIVLVVYLAVMLPGLGMSLAVKIKTKTLVKSSCIYLLLRALWKAGKWLARVLAKVIGVLPLIWKTVLIVTGLALIELVVLLKADRLVFWWVLEMILLIPAVLFVAWSLYKLQKGARRIASGDFEHRVDTEGLFWDFKEHAENLNSISAGMTVAVEEKLRSERMKTELITNVSHDIKTPLTSIINYAGLLAEENLDDASRTEYAGVLIRQSDKLKRLIEDLVEASKASTGNLEILPAPCDVCVFLSQASGEYEDKMQEAGLQLVTKFPEKRIRILADSRRMWRVFDNLMNNIYKYAQQGTRVYLTLEEHPDTVTITFKNISREPLNIAASELMERFVRGDASRNTDGNGLGLSIARSLTELQGGKFSVEVDGDLFKVMLEFPIH